MILHLKNLIRTLPLIASKKFCTSISDAVITKKIGRVTCIGLNRPNIKNCLNVEVLTQLKSALEVFENDTSSSAAVLYGEQGTFSYGIHQNEINNDMDTIQQLIKEITETFYKKPIVAAINGFATGSGFELALWCDFRIVEETAVMAAYARTFGVPLSETTAKLLFNLVGVYRAQDWVLTGRIVQAKELLDCGIATRIVACGAALGQAVNFANSLCNMPQACLRADRATLLSISDKFSSPITKKIILDEKEENLKIALEEAKKGVHITESGDVRRK